MARTPAGLALTEQHRQGQLRIRAQALRDYAAIWPIWIGDERSFHRLLDASVPLLRAYHTLSATLAAGYFDSFRRVEDVGGVAAPQLAAPLEETRARGTLYVTGLEMTRKALTAGFTPQAAMRTAFVRTSGTATRLALTGGRDTVVLSTAGDSRARGWARVASGNACAFCAMLASRGAVYSEDTADFESHDHCTCSAEPQYEGAALPPSSQRYSHLWDEAQREARANGEDTYGRASALNAFRRHLSRQ